MRILEKTLIVLFLIGLTFKMSHYPGASMILAISLLGLAGLYFYLGFLIFHGIRLRQIFKKEAYREVSGTNIAFAVVAGVLASTALVGVLFDLMLLPGAQIMLLIGFLGLSLVTALSLIGVFRLGLSSLSKRLFTRILPITLLSIIMYIITDSQLIDIYYRRYPNVKTAYKALLEDPDNVDLRHQLDDAINNMRDEKE